MNKLTVFRGNSGFDGVDGINGISANEIDDLPIASPLFNVLGKNHLSKVGNIEFDRTSIATHENRHKKHVTAGDVTVTNYCKDSSDYSQWSVFGGRASIVGSTTDPFGGSLATEINLLEDTVDETGFTPVFITTLDVTAPISSDFAISVYAKLISGSAPRIEYSLGSDNFVLGELTSSWQRFTLTQVLDLPLQVFGINPKGSTGARVALYGVQVEDSHYSTPLIETTGTKASLVYLSDYERENHNGWLIQKSKENAVSYSGNLEQWTPLNCTIARYNDVDPFGLPDQFTKFVWASIPEVSITGQLVGSITPLAEYTVSFWAYLTAGSLFGITVSVGGGEAVSMPPVATDGFQRISAVCVAGVSSDIVITPTSTNLTAKLKISGVQVESGEMTSYIRTNNTAIARTSDIVTAPYAWNIPAPNLPWSCLFHHSDILTSATRKTVFTNDQTGSDEFSCYFQNSEIFIKNGAVAVSVAAINFKQILITFDGSILNIYNGRTLIKTETITPSTFINTTLYIGMDSSEDNAINGRLSNLMFYNVKLTNNEITYLTGL